MKLSIVVMSVMLLAANAGWAEDTNYPKAKVSFNDFKRLVAEVETHRGNRLVDLNTFMKMSKEPGVIILDTRSAFRFDRIHIKGAKHLAFTDFTQDNLQKAIPSLDTKILIYCNNNFDGNQRDFASKAFMPNAKAAESVATQFANQSKPIMMALNIPTYVNLYGYGYRNVYELHELVDVNDLRITFEGTVAEKKLPALAPTIKKHQVGDTQSAPGPLRYGPDNNLRWSEATSRLCAYWAYGKFADTSRSGTSCQKNNKLASPQSAASL